MIQLLKAVSRPNGMLLRKIEVGNRVVGSGNQLAAAEEAEPDTDSR